LPLRCRNDNKLFQVNVAPGRAETNPKFTPLDSLDKIWLTIVR